MTYIRACDSDDPIIKEALEKIKSGELPISSGPTDVVWTEDDKRRLNEALKRVFGTRDRESG